MNHSRTRKPNTTPNASDTAQARLAAYAKDLLCLRLGALLEGGQAEEFLDDYTEDALSRLDDDQDAPHELIHPPEMTEFQLWAVACDEASVATLDLGVVKHAIPDTIVEQLQNLSHDAQGWLHRRHGSNRLTFLSLTEWKELYAEWKTSVVAEHATSKATTRSKSPN